MLGYGFLLASALGTALVLRALSKESPRALAFSLLATVVVPVLVWRLAFEEQEFPLTSYVTAACSLAATILIPGTLAHFAALLARGRGRTAIVVTVVIALILWLPIVAMGGFVGTCGLDRGCDP